MPLVYLALRLLTFSRVLHYDFHSVKSPPVNISNSHYSYYYYYFNPREEWYPQYGKTKYVQVFTEAESYP